jgi:outer membrane protein assembly factor BamB
MGNFRCLTIGLVLLLLTPLFVFSPITVASSEDDWSMYNHDAANTGYTTSQGPKEMPDLLWTYPPSWLEAPSWVSASAPVISNGRLFFSSSDYFGKYTLYAVNASTGQEIWTKPYGLNLKSQELPVSPAVKGDIVYTCSYAYYAVTGDLLLNYSSQTIVRIVGHVQPSNSFNSPTISDDTIFLSYPGSLLFSGGGIIAIDSNSGKLKWSFTTNGSVAAVPAVVDGKVYFSAYDGKVYALDSSTGAEVWERALGQPSLVPMDSSPTVIDGHVYIGTSAAFMSNSNTFYCLDTQTGRTIWTFHTDDSKTSIAVNHGLVCLTSGGNVYSLKADNGAKVWSMAFANASQSFVSSSLALTGDIVYVAASNGKLLALDVSNGNNLWNYTFFGETRDLPHITSPAISNGVVYMIVGQTLYALGKSISTPRPTTPPLSLPWKIQTIDSSGSVGYISIVLNSKNKPQVAYVDFTGEPHNHLKYANWTSAGWSIQTVDWIGGWGGYCSLALDSNDVPHISYYDSELNGLKYASFNGSGWNMEIVDTTGVGRASSLAIDANDNPHISYCNNRNVSLKYVQKTASGWTFQAVDQNVDVMWYTSLTLDSAGNPHIAYFDNLNNQIKYASLIGNKWRAETVVHGGGPVSLALDANDNPHIIYHNNYAFNYAIYTGSAWNVKNINSGSPITGCYISIALDSLGNPHVSYTDLGGSLLYTTYNGSEWATQSIDSGNGTTGAYSSIVLDSNDNPHIAYSYNTKQGLKYTTLSNFTVIQGQSLLTQNQTILIIIPITVLLVIAIAMVALRKRGKTGTPTTKST